MRLRFEEHRRHFIVCRGMLREIPAAVARHGRLAGA